MGKIFIPLERIDIDNIPLHAAKEEIIRCNAEITRLNKIIAAEQRTHPTPESGRELPAEVVKSENALPAESE